MSDMKVGDLGVLQNMYRPQLNGMVAEITRPLGWKKAADKHGGVHDRLAYGCKVPGTESFFDKYGDIDEWAVQKHQIRPLSDPDQTEQQTEKEEVQV